MNTKFKKNSNLETAYEADAVHVDLETYDDFINNWHQLIQDTHTETEDEFDTSTSNISQVEKLAQNTFSKLIEQDSSNPENYAASRIFKNLQNSAVICDDTAKVIFNNSHAITEYGLNEGIKLSATNIRFENGESLDCKILNISKENVDYSQLQVLQCFDEHDASIPISIMKLPDNTNHARFLVVFMSTPWNETAQNLFMSKFNLTDAEIDVVKGFSQGISLKEIAASRERSYATIRNQFQSALEKTGCPSQADLLRLLLGASYLFSQIETSIKEQSEVIGRRIELIRPKGRFLEVQLYGDLQGDPFICLPSIFGFPATADIEKELVKRKLLMICVSRPGFGGTSHPIEGQNLYDCLAGDIKALLDSMEITQCLLLGRASAARSLFNLIHRMPERFTSAFMVNSLVPRPFIKTDNIISKWTTSLMLATKLAPSVATLILGTGQKMMMKNGAEPFIKRMYRHSVSDCKAAEDPAIARSIYEGAELVTKQGLTAGVKDMIDGFEDWSDEVERIKMKVTLLQGRFDPNVPIAGSQAFATYFKDQLELVEFEDGGGLLNYTHSDKIFDILQSS